MARTSIPRGSNQRPNERADSHPGPGLAEGGTSLASSDLAEVVRLALSMVSKGGRADLTILEELVAHGFSREELFDLVVPRRTLARRQQADDRLSLEESDRAIRLARITAMAERVFGDDVKAHRWMRKPSPMLEGSSPLALLKTETGAHLVEQALHRIDYGMFA